MPDNQTQTPPEVYMTIGPRPPSLDEQLAEIRRSTGAGGVPSVNADLSLDEQLRLLREGDAKISQELRGSLGIPREWLQYGIEQGSPVAGGLIGQAIGMPLGPLTSMAGSVIGTGLGAQLPNVTRPFLTPWAPQPTLPEAAHDVFSQSKWSLGGELGGTLLGKLGSKILPSTKGMLAGSVTPEARSAQNTLRELGSSLTPGQLTMSPAVQTLENAAEGFITTQGRMLKFKTGQFETLHKAALDLVDQLGSGPTGSVELGDLFGNIVAGGNRFARAVEKGLYTGVDDLAKGVTVDTNSVVQAIEGAKSSQTGPVKRALEAAFADVSGGWETLLRGSPSKQAKSVAYLPSQVKVPAQTLPPVTLYSPSGTKLPSSPPPPPSYTLKGGTKSKIFFPPIEPENVGSFTSVTEARSRLLAVSRKPGATPESQATAKAAGYLAGKLDSAIEESSKRLAPDALDAWRTANQFTATEREILDNRLIRTIASKLEGNPEVVTRVLEKGMNPTQISKVRNAVGPEKWPIFQASLAQRMVSRSQVLASGLLDFKALQGELDKMGEEGLVRAFGSDWVSRMHELTTAGVFIRQKAETGTGNVAIKLMQVGAIGGAAYGGVQLMMSPSSWSQALKKMVPLATLLISTEVISRIFTNPRAIQELTTVMKSEPGTQPFLRAVGRVAGLAGQRNSDTIKEKLGVPKAVYPELSAEWKGLSGEGAAYPRPFWLSH